jgi:hypothetical protein
MSRSRWLRRMTAKGDEERFPPTRLSGRCGFRKETIAGTRSNGSLAPETVIEFISGDRLGLDFDAPGRLGASVLAEIGVPHDADFYLRASGLYG